MSNQDNLSRRNILISSKLYSNVTSDELLKKTFYFSHRHHFPYHKTWLIIVQKATFQLVKG